MRPPMNSAVLRATKGQIAREVIRFTAQFLISLTSALQFKYCPQCGGVHTAETWVDAAHAQPLSHVSKGSGHPSSLADTSSGSGQDRAAGHGHHQGRQHTHQHECPCEGSQLAEALCYSRKVASSRPDEVN
jgi:hypothetical protein